MSATSSDAPSPSQSAARSSRVCINCRKKKKRCDKALPSCGRCTLSLETCQHEDDDGSRHGESSTTGSLGGMRSFVGQDFLHAATSPYMSDPILEHIAGQQAAAHFQNLNPSLFASMDSGENIHNYVARCVGDIIGPRTNALPIMTTYFSTVHTWFTIVPEAQFMAQLDDFPHKTNAELCVTVMAMLLAIRQPIDHSPSGMADSLYHSIKGMITLVESKLPLSVQLLKAELLVALYESSHDLPQQAYMTIGRCCQMMRAFGWHQKAFWTEERRSLHPKELKMCSVLWWAVVYLDSTLHVSYQEQNYPITTSDFTSDFQIPFPEAFAQYFSGHLSYAMPGQSSNSAGMDFLDSRNNAIEGLVWPESTSAFYLTNALQRLGQPTPLSAAERDSMSGAITHHTINVMGGNWKQGNRFAVVGTNFISLLRLNQAQLLLVGSGSGSSAPHHQDETVRPIQTVRSVITSVINSCETFEEAPAAVLNGCVAPCSAVCGFAAALLLVRHGDGALQDGQWLEKVETLKRNLALMRKRWTIADRYLTSVNVALNNRLSGMYTA